jgi:uroporphyrinogen-III synthase
MRVLVTRPKGKGESLVSQLKTVVERVHYQPVIEIVPGADVIGINDNLKVNIPDILIFVSGFAVEHFILAMGSNVLPSNKPIVLMAVGKATADTLNDWCKQTVAYPQLETTEGLLAMAQLQASQVNDHKVVIVRGVGGRELLASELQSRGAQTDYWQLYRRQAVNNQGELWYDQWKRQQINCIVITSVSILTALFDSLPKQAHDWLMSIKWVVASHRIGDKAKALGIDAAQIYDAQGATNSAIVAQVKRLIES